MADSLLYRWRAEVAGAWLGVAPKWCYLFCMKKNELCCPYPPFPPNHCIVMGKHLSFAFLSLPFTVRVHKENFTMQNCLVPAVVGDWLWWWPREVHCSVVFCISALTTSVRGMFSAVWGAGWWFSPSGLFSFCSGILFCIWYILIFQLSETKPFSFLRIPQLTTCCFFFFFWMMVVYYD